MEVSREKGPPVRVIALLYHDVVENADWNSSGFTGPGTAKYKLNRPDFAAHLRAIAASRDDAPCRAHDLLTANPSSLPFLLTFDDGGESAYTRIAGVLEELGWCGHFFVTAGRIGQRGFLTRAQIRELKNKGHVIGSHSFSHPTRMSHCSGEELMNEWTTSVQILADVLGEGVDTASVPGGYYGKKVAETAVKAGIRILFNSEPTTRIQVVSGCVLIGRFNVFRGKSPSFSGDLVSASPKARVQQWLFWNSKKIAKIVAGGPYLKARQVLLRRG